MTRETATKYLETGRVPGRVLAAYPLTCGSGPEGMLFEPQIPGGHPKPPEAPGIR